jgi:hypothetical protein
MESVKIPSGFILYRGSYDESAVASGYNTPNYLRNNRPYYFLYNNNNKNGLNVANRAYGHVTTYATSRPLQLVNLGHAQTVLKLMNQASDPMILKSIMKSFRVKQRTSPRKTPGTPGPNRTNVIRSSKANYDMNVARFICHLGYDGYWTPKLSQKYGNKKFHQEIVLCHPKSCLRVVRVEQPSRPPSVAPKRLKRMPFSNSPRPVRRFNFNNDAFD